MTDEMISLRTLLEKSSDAELLREMIGFTAQRLMGLEVERLTGAAHRNAVRSGSTNAMAIVIGCGKPAPARWNFASPSAKAATSRGFLEPRWFAEKALAAVVQEAYVHSVSTRSVDVVKAMGMPGISKNEVSRLCAEIDDKMKAFLSRQIEGDRPYVDRRHLPEGAPERTHRLSGGNERLLLPNRCLLKETVS